MASRDDIFATYKKNSEKYLEKCHDKKSSQTRKHELLEKKNKVNLS